MCDIFTQTDIHNVLKGRSYLFIGDSIMRNLYKDLVWLTCHPRQEFIKTKHMQRKTEPNLGDRVFMVKEERLIHKSIHGAGRDFEEIRDYYNKELDIQYSFCFITKCWSKKIEDFLEKYPQQYGSYPDVIMINSALWDINRWGKGGTRHFRYNIHSLLHHLKWILRKTPYVQVIWMTTPPISTEIRGGFMVRQIEFAKLSMRCNIMEGNQYAANAAGAYGFDVLDMHYYMSPQVHRRAADGIHWNSEAVRMQVNVFLTHFCLSRGIELQNKWKKSRRLVMPKNILLEEAKLAQRAAFENFRKGLVHRGKKLRRLRPQQPYHYQQHYQQRTFVHARRRHGPRNDFKPTGSNMVQPAHSRNRAGPTGPVEQRHGLRDDFRPTGSNAVHFGVSQNRAGPTGPVEQRHGHRDVFRPTGSNAVHFGVPQNWTGPTGPVEQRHGLCDDFRPTGSNAVHFGDSQNRTGPTRPVEPRSSWDHRRSY